MKKRPSHRLTLPLDETLMGSKGSRTLKQFARLGGKKVNKPIAYDPHTGHFVSAEDWARDKAVREEAQLRWLLDLAQRKKGPLLPSDAAMLKLFVGQYTEPPPEFSIKALQKLAVEVYEFISNAKRWEFGLPHARCVVEWEGPSYAFSRLTTPDWRAAFRLGVADLLRVHARWIRKCGREGCGRLFLAYRRQVFCSSQCSQRVRFARYWKGLSSQERYQKRHEHYAETIRRKHGSARVIHERRQKGETHSDTQTRTE